ncbi:MAG: DUF1583 domain-containing protein [Pirellulaceae bacterium]
MIEIEARNFEAAERQLTGLITVARTRRVFPVERSAEGVVMQVASQHPELLELTLELANLVWQQGLASSSPMTERWHRFLYSIVNRLRSRTELDRPAMTEVSWTGRPIGNWNSESRMTAQSCGQGFPVARWLISKGEVHHVAGHDGDVLCFATPLLDNYELEGDLTTFHFRETHLFAAGFWAGLGSDRTAVDNGSFFKTDARRYAIPPLTRMFDWMRVRVVVRNGFRTTYINGRPIYRMPHSVDSDPWAGVHALWFSHGSVKDLRITADDEWVPQEIPLRVRSGLHGWIPYHDVSNRAPWRVLDVQPYEVQESLPNAQDPSQIVGRRQLDIEGSDAESLLAYHRPMIEDGVISYEFLYRPGRALVHPALGRLAFLLKEDGVSEHWITDGRHDRTGLRPGNESVHKDRQRGPAELPLQPGGWNHIELKRSGDAMTLVLNGVAIYERAIDDITIKRFGLFHYADKTSASVRNIRWKGNWQQRLPSLADQQLADVSLEEILGDPAELDNVFVHDFGDGLPVQRFIVSGDQWRQHFQQVTDGVYFSRPVATVTTAS